MQLLMIDNFDSFTFNLAQYFGELGVEIRVARNNAITLPEISRMKPDAIVISPGPGVPDSAGITLPLIKEFAGTYPILGVCLGHQAIGQAFGGKVVRAGELMHGKTSAIRHNGARLFKGIRNPFTATRYHSLVVDTAAVPASLTVTARTEDEVIMGLEHREYPITGVQFHPESFLTEYGKELLNNFLTFYVKKEKVI